MKSLQDIHYGTRALNGKPGEARGSLVSREGEDFYRIEDYDGMSPFFMTVVSSSDHWMFVSSLGGLTCGRKDPGNALFPYYTDDKIHDSYPNTGPRTLFLANRGKGWQLWEPFLHGMPELYYMSRNIYKNRTGNKMIFEELNHDLGLAFSYTWMNSETYGIVRQSRIRNLDEGNGLELRVMDGLQNILPAGVDQGLQAGMSTLVDGYKQCELHETTGLGIYTLSSILTDRAEPSEALEATTLWSTGLPSPRYLLSGESMGGFRSGLPLEGDKYIRGRRGAYFVHDEFELGGGKEMDWLIVAELRQGPSDVPQLISFLEGEDEPGKKVLEDVRRGTERLEELVALADGQQHSEDALATGRHFSNTLFNLMRGGVFPEEYRIDPEDFSAFVGQWNRKVYNEHASFLVGLKPGICMDELFDAAVQKGDPDLSRLVREYLPLSFSRRHGDPSRPWNQFSIDIRNDDGSRKLNYQGNWRDIFQNWEALSLSFPGYIESFITRFVNASTVDGYNPYRLTREGIDWEILDPEDPWSNIGYWGDHQVVYLSRLLELSLRYHPGALGRLLDREEFVYAAVPYRVRPYDELVKDPYDTITYDEELATEIEKRVVEKGSDGKLVHGNNGELVRTGLAEKLLVSLLARLLNFVPEGGIWMNTQRPEWNDANNALVGNGLSMVTLYYLRRFTLVLEGLFADRQEVMSLAAEVADLLHRIFEIFLSVTPLSTEPFTAKERRQVVDALGKAGSSYREGIYTKGFSGKKRKLGPEELLEFLKLSRKILDHSIAANRRSDGLFHSYNLVEFTQDACHITCLQEMLEGQVALLSSGYLETKQQIKVLDALYASRMYRSDQDSFTLYPDKEQPSFLEKNQVPMDLLERSPFLLEEMKKEQGGIVEKDLNGKVHFDPGLRNASELLLRLDLNDSLSPGDKKSILEIYEACFRHREFTGRSGSFFKYEGLGCIYWHMVSKLQLAVQELCFGAGEGEDRKTLTAYYRRIRDGLGLKKSPGLYGAFTTDPYSHTTSFGGVQQPGMTGQVKEDIIARFGELGVCVEDGCISFNPFLLQHNEFSKSDGLKFTLCGTPVFYTRGESESIEVVFRDGRRQRINDSLVLGQELSSMVFDRTGEVDSLRCSLMP